MTTWALVTRSLRFYWRTHLSVLLGVMVSTAILVGALVIGDSVRHSLKAVALARLGKVQLALVPQNRYFRAKLADDLKRSLKAETAPVLLLRGIAANDDGTARVNRVQVLGVDDRFWVLGAGKPSFDADSRDEVCLNERLATQLGVREGEEILLRAEKPSLLPRDAPLSTDDDTSVAMRVNVRVVVSEENFGRFSLQANQIPPFNAFVSLAWLQQKVGLPDRANTLLIGDSATGEQKVGEDKANAALREHWDLADADVELRELPEQGVFELRTGRVFLDPFIGRASEEVDSGTIRILTYFVNELRNGNRATPYSIVTAMDNPPAKIPPAPLSQRGGFLHPTQPEMSDDEILINTWLAEDLQAKPGDMLKLTYFVFGPMRKLEERSRDFRVRAVLPIEGAAADRELMPLFPGLSDAENCRDWDPGIPIDLDKIRDKDEEYWDLYRGTPKAFVTLKAGQDMWGNRFGNLTALRYPVQANTRKTLETAIKRGLNPASIGLFFQPVREQALAASEQALDFGQLFLGLSLFLIVAALLLTGLLFVFGVEQRGEEIGTLLALGFPPARVRRLFLFEGSTLALLGGVLGVFGGIWYTKVMLYALSTVWQGALGRGEGAHTGATLHYYANPSTLIVGAVASIFIALLAIWVTLRKQAKSPARALLASGGDTGSGFWALSATKSKLGLWVGLGAIVGAVVILFLVGKGRDKGAASVFFAAGALLLVGGLGFAHALLSPLARSPDKIRMSLSSLGLRNSARRIGRSLATVVLLACGSFLTIAVGANRYELREDAQLRSSGTGGFTLFAESSLPVFHDLNNKPGRETYGLNSDDLKDVEFVSLRVHDGDDASCLNLNRAQTPRLLGIRPEELQTRHAFTFAKTVGAKHSQDERMLRPYEDNPWLLLKLKEDEDTVPAIGDDATITWALGKKLGDTIPYTDERGNQFNLRLMGAISNSIFQGGLLISEDEFIKRFPSESGYRLFLIDAPIENAAAISKRLSRALQDVGLEITPTAQRLAEFNTVQNTYLSIFQILGGLALLLGSVGLGIVVSRNVMERRNELALLRAVGFEKRSLRWLVISEHWLLLLLGLASGVVAGLIAVLPALRSPGADVPYFSLALTLSAVVLSGLLWTWLATILALRGPLLNALRNE